jgi:prepilin-type N-terminal cleavage/methylation domain-containing protein
MKMPHRDRAFSLTELMVTVAVIGILSSIVILITGNEWRRERVQAVQVDLVGWLEAVRRAALRGNSCTVTIDTTIDTPGQELGTVSGSCLYQLPMTVPGVTATGTRYAFSAEPKELVFTPRGTVRGSSGSLATDALISITLEGGGPMACIAISPTVGAIRSGLIHSTDSNACSARLAELL